MRDPFIEKENFDIIRWTRKYIVPISLFIFTGILATNYFINRTRVNQAGVYVLARVTTIRDYRQGTNCSEYEYFYRRHKFMGGGCGNFDHVGDLYFIKLIPSDPSNYFKLEFTEVPICLTMDSVPESGWQTLPTCSGKSYK